ncbi:MAG TPA: SLC13 family permease [bacterium]|nr:SLC13 family permease [bacterium]HPG44304.1 SLC13 family permease [bacterium]HPM96671.1 SLC13 family permease [bacterium]
MQTTLVFSTLLLLFLLFIWGRIRHDFAALIGLFLLVIAGIVPADEAFAGFGHPAVITVAAVLIIGKALEYSGLIDLLGKWVTQIGKNLLLQILALSSIVAVASAFMNNVGALAIMMPVALHIARKNGHPPSYLLMPISFASLLGGMTTLIGTPPNIIIATFRADLTGESFGMFSFSRVGLPIALSGILFIGFIGWRFLPKRTAQKSEKDLFDIDDYITEVKVSKESKAKGLSIAELGPISDADVQIIGLIRKKKHLHELDENEILQINDILILEADAEALEVFLQDTRMELVGGKQFRKDAEGSKDIAISEAIVMAGSPLIGQTAAGIRMRSRYGVNLLAVARREKKIRLRLDHVRFQTGDVLLLQGRSHLIDQIITSIGCLPLARRGLRLGFEKKIILSLSIFSLSIAAVVAGLLPVQISFSIAAVAMVLSGLLPLRQVYESVDWPVIVLLGAMIPVGGALESSGGAALVAEQILRFGESLPVYMTIALLLVVTMFLSDIINNAATVVLMAPIGIKVAQGLGVSIDPFLMAVAIGGSCAFLTPIGHQSNTLVMGPGGYKFSDYWRMGLPLELLILLVSVPAILYFWPL